MRVGIMVPSLSQHDAVGNDALGMYQALTRHGIECFIFTAAGVTNHPLLINRYDDIPILLSSSEDILIYHYCVADSMGLISLRRSRCRLILRYHNITPASFMAPYCREFALGCKRGREMLIDFAELPLIGVLNDSDFNGTDLQKLIPSEVTMHTLAPLHVVDSLLGEADHFPTQLMLDESWFNILTVGRVVPNKGLEMMLEHFADAADAGVTGIRLHVVGGRDPRLGIYSHKLDEITEARGITGSVVWHNGVSGEVLATLYRYSDVYWTASQHEGFCVPVVEAMGFGLPVLSTRKGALPETCRDAALFADRSYEAVQQLKRLATDDVFRVQLGRQGRLRYEKYFRLKDLEARFLNFVERFRQESEVLALEDEVSVEGDWFGIPDAEEFVRGCLVDGANPTRFAVSGTERRKSFIDAIVRSERRSPRASAFLGSESFVRYAADIDVPIMATQLAPAMRLAWRFDPVARTSFSLTTRDDVGAFLAWYEVFAKTAYEGAVGAPAPML